MHRHSLAASIVLTLVATPVVAQDFLGRMARAAAERGAATVIGNAATATTAPSSAAPGSPVATAPTATPRPGRSTGQQGAVVPASSFASPAPINFRPGMKKTDDLEFSAEDVALRRRFHDHILMPCSDCEGGKEFVMSLEVGERIGAMKVGDAIDFPVPRHNAHGRMVVVSEQPIGDWPCKQVRWSFTRDGETRESPGVFCYARRGYYLEHWHHLLH